jgi:hypothetical protein
MRIPIGVKAQTAAVKEVSSGVVLITFAWVVEIVGSTAGVLNAAYTTYGDNPDNWPTTFFGWIPALPMAVLAIAELGRVPLASVVYARHLFIRAIALLGILALGYLAFENWTFGFERIVNLRLGPVNVAHGNAVRAERELAALKQQSLAAVTIDDKKVDELRRGIEQRQAAIAELSAQLSEAAKVHKANLESILANCRVSSKRDDCIRPETQRENASFEQDTASKNAELARQNEEKRQLQTQIDRLVVVKANDAASLGPKIATAEGIVSDARSAFRKTVENNQIYRLAASWYGVDVEKVTGEQFATARLVFATFSALAIAFAGGIAALVYYAPVRAPGARSTFVRLVLKLRRRTIVDVYRDGKLEVPVPGPTVYVPVSVPVPGIWTLLFERWFGNRDARQSDAAASGDSAASDNAASGDNVRSFTKGK